MTARDGWRADERHALKIGAAEIVLEDDRTGALPRSLNVYASANLAEYEAGSLVGCIRDEDAMRDLRDALSALLGDRPGVFSDSVRQEIAEAESRGYRRGVAARMTRDRTAVPSRVIRSEPFGIPESPRRVRFAPVDAGRPISAVEVEVFREAWEAGEPGSRIRDGLTAVENYRTWKANR